MAGAILLAFTLALRAQTGSVDTNFIANANSTVYSTAVQPDGKVLVGGAFTLINGIARNRLARFNADNTLDTNFNPNVSGDVNSIAVQADGRILMGGTFTTVGGVGRVRLARLNPDGTLDSAFNPAPTLTVYSIALQPDGKILAGGDFTTMAGVARNRLARLNPDGSMDTNFVPSVSGSVYSIAVQADGKVVIGGSFTTVNSIGRNNCARLNSDGTLDTNFNPNASSSVYSLALQADGRILMGGFFSQVSGTNRSSLARLSTNGLLDLTFTNTGSTVYSISVQADGKIIVGGAFTSIGPLTRNRIARINADGSVDSTFNPNAGGTLQSTALQADGKVLMGGFFSTAGGLSRTNFARVQNDATTQSLTVPTANRIEWLRGGALPEAQSVSFDFSTDSGSNWIALGNGARISGGWELTNFVLPDAGLVRGRARVPSSGYTSSSLVETTAAFSGFVSLPPAVTTAAATNITDVVATLRAVINPSGSPATAWFEYGTTTNYGSITNITLSPSNGATPQAVSVTVGGLTPGTEYHFRALATNSAGATGGGDMVFSTLLYPEIVVEQPAGTNLVDGAATNSFGFNLLGSTNGPRVFTIRNTGLTNLTGLWITKDGVHSNDFILDTNSMSTSLAPGASTTFNITFVTGSTGTRTAAIHVANNDQDENPFDITLTGSGYRPGDLETNFNPNANGNVYNTVIQPDGKILVGGSFTTISTPARSYLVRLNADGTLDPAFTNANNIVQSILLLPDGKVLIGGDFTSVAGVTRNRLARLNANGTLDLGFSNTVNSSVYNMVLQPDGKILIAGAFSSVNGVTRNRLARLNSDGTLDLGFTNFVNNFNVYALTLQADGKIVIGGDFSLVNGVTRNNLARLNTNGTLDLTFSNAFNNTVYCAVMQPDGKLLVGGQFGLVNGVTRNRLARFNVDGTLDSLDLNANSPVYTLALQTDGKIIVGGNFFNVFGSVPRNYIARMNADGTLDTNFNPNAQSDVYSVGIQQDGRLVVGGLFTAMGGTARGRIARLLNDGTTHSLTVPSASRVEWLRGGASPETAGVTFDLSTDGGLNWLGLGAGTRISGGWELAGLSLPPSGQVRARGRASTGRYNGSSGLIETNVAFSGFVASPPVVNTTPATSINVLTATLNANINPSALATTAQFEYGTTTNYGSTIGITLSPTNGASSQHVSAPIAGLTGGTTYHFRAIASNSVGITFGSNVTFNTLAQPEIAVEQPADTDLIDGFSTVSLGTGMIANATAPQTFVIRNQGVEDLTGLTISKDGAHAADFIVDTNGMNSTVAPGATTTFTVTFTPLTLTGTRTAAIHIANNDSDESPFDITITGTAIKAGDLDLAFNPNASDFVRAAVGQTDGKILINGFFTSVGGTPRTNIARLNADGTLDTSFHPAPNSSVEALTLESNQKILVGGFFTNIGAQARNRIARLNTNGTADAAVNSGANATVSSIVPQPDGKLILCGTFTNVAGLTRHRIARLNVDGTVDTGFNPHADDSVASALVQSDGKIIVWGNFQIIGGRARNRFARLNADGTSDDSYNPAADGIVSCAVFQPDGKLLVGGTFLNISGVARSRLARLNADGTADAGFAPVANESVGTISIQTDGKILVGGAFTSMAGATRLYLARLLTNGAIDTVFNPTQGFGVSGISVQPDGRILVTGSFTSPRNRIARLINDNVSQALTVASVARVEWLRGGASPEVQRVTFDLSTDGGSSWTPIGAGARIAGGWELTGLSLPGSGLVRAQGSMTGGSGNTASWVVESVTNFAGLPAPEIVVEQPAGTSVVDGESRSFGSLLMGNNAAITFTISNAGNANLSGISVTKDGVHSNDFTLDTSGTSATLAAGASTTFTVTFAPGALGARTAAIHIANNDADENPFDIALSGTGIAPEIGVEHPAGTSLTNDLATIDFGSLTPATSSAPKTFTITNAGLAALNGLAVTVDGANASDFAVDASAMAASLAPGASTTFNVTFTPALAGSRNAALHIASDDADENPFDIALIGTGVNRSPIVANAIPNQNATANVSFGYTFAADTFADPDAAQSLAYSVTRTSGAVLPAWLTFTAATRSFTGTPSPADAGILSLRVIATDNGTPALSATNEFDIEVSPIAPAVTTLPATSVAAFGATLEASINPNGLATAAQFEYGTSPSYGSIALITLSPNNGTAAQAVSVAIPNLVPNTTYHFRATATNSAGGNAGIDRSFTTPPPPPGLADGSFNPSSPFAVWNFAVQPDGKILVGGEFVHIGGQSYLPRLNTDGTRDPTFSPFNFSKIESVMVLPDLKVFVGGGQANVETGINVVRMNTDGSVDTSFDRFAVNGYVKAVALQPDGKMVIGGYFTSVFGQPRSYIARFNADGTLDTGFNPTANAQVFTIQVLPTGKIFIGGLFSQVGGQPANNIARLNADGTLDTSFANPTTAWVAGSALQADGKIILLGGLHQGLGRLHPDGTLDPGFAPTVNGIVHGAAIQTDGRIVVVGSFTQLAGQPRNHIGRLNIDGSIDPLFNPNANNEVFGVALQADGKVLVGGQFTNISGQAHTRVARLNNDQATQSLSATSPNRIQWLRGGSSPEAASVTFELSADGGIFWTPLGAGSRIAGGWEKTGFALPPSGLIRARARVPGGTRGGSVGVVESTVSFSGFPPSAPYVTTLAASGVNEFGATLHAIVNPAGAATVAQFEYGTTTNYGSTASITLSPNDGTSAQQTSVTLNQLLPGVLYHFRVTATNGLGGASGSDLTFTTQGYPEISVEQPGGTALVDGGTIAYGTNVIGAPLTKTFIITNLGTTNLAGLSISKNGANASEFIVSALTNLIPPGGSATFDVTFNPATPGAKTAAIHITSNDSDESPFDLNLTATAIAPEIAVEAPPGTGRTSNLSACCDEVFVGQLTIGQTNSTTVLVRNLGTANLALSSLVLVGGNADQYSLTSLTATNLPPGSNATFVIKFHPTSGGEKITAFQLFNNDGNENPFQLQVRGSCDVPDIVVEQPSGNGLTNGISTVDFNNTFVGTPVVKTFYIRNNGNHDLTGLALTKDGTNAADFTIGQLFGFSVYPGTYESFDVSFTPLTTGAKTAVLHIASSDPDENPFDIVLTGAGLEAPEIVVEHPAGTNLTDAASTIDYGTISVSTTLTKTFTVKNTGTTELMGLSLSVDGVDAAEFTASALSTNTLAPESNTTFEVTFNPSTAGAKSAAIHLASNDGDENPFDIALSGTGSIGPEIVVEHPPGTPITDGVGMVAFGGTPVNTPVTKTFTIRNIGVGDLTGLSLSKSGNGSGDFSLGTLSASIVSPGGNATFDVTFDATIAGTKSAVIHLANNDSNENPFDINITATGLGPEIAVEQPLGTNLIDGVSTLTFDTPVGTPSAKVFWIRNVGNTDMTNFGFAVSGPNAGDFVIGPFSIGASALRPGEIANIQLNFYSGTTGNKSAVFHIASNDPDENTFDINLTATVTDAPEISVRHFGMPFDGAMGSINFGGKRVGTPSSTTFEIVNVGTLPLTNISVSTGGPDGGDFSAHSLTATTLGAGASATFALTFTPSSTGSRAATLHVASSDLDENPFNIGLLGFGVTNFTPALTRANAAVVVPVNTIATNHGTFGDADGDSVSLTASLGVLTTNDGTWGWSYTPTMIGTQTVTITADDTHEIVSVTFTVAARESIPPTAAFVPVTPDPRTNAVGAMTLNFSEDVSGVSAADFLLTRNGVPVSLGGLAVTPINALTYELQLASFTGTPGAYVLTLVAAGSGIVDAAGNALVGDTSDSFSIASSASSVSNGNLLINNSQSGSMALTFRALTVGGTNYIEIRDANNAIVASTGATQVDANTVRVPASSITNQFQITGGPGDDHFVFDATDGCPLPPGGVNIDGGGQTLNGGDALQIIGTFSSVQYDANNIGSGNLQDDCGAVNFSGFEPVDYTLATIGNLVVNVDPQNQFADPVTSTLSAVPGSGNEGNTRVGFSGGLELMDFGTLTGTVTLTGDSAGLDTIVVQGVGTNFAGHLAIAAQAADSVLLTNTTLTLGTAKSFDVAAGSVTVGAATVSGGTAAFHGGSIAMNIGGAAPGAGANQHSRLTVFGAVVLSNSPTLNLTGSYVPQPGESFMLIDNDGADAVIGAFAGLPEGANFVFNGATLHLSYAGGSGNDVVLSVAVPPTINCGQNETLNLGLSWDFTVPIVTANCGTATLSILSTTTNQTCGATFVATRVWLATNTCGMSTTCTQVVTIIDVTGPSIICPSNITVECAAQVPPADFAGGSAADDGSNPTIVHLGDVSSGVNPRTITRSYRATDACSNSTVCAQTIIVHDTNAPTINCPADIIVAADTNSCTASSVSLGAPIVADNCSVTFTNDAPAQLPLGVTWVTWTATDAVGNNTTCTQRVTVVDVSLAITSQPQSTTNNIGTTATFAVTAVGCADLSYQWSFATNILAGETNATLTLTNLQASQGGEYVVKVSNAGGSVTSVVAALAVGDFIAPTITCPSNVTVQCLADVPLANFVGGSVSDNLDPSPAVVHVGDVTNGACPLVITRTYRATDASNNTAVCAQSITVHDTTPPVINCGQNETLHVGLSWDFTVPIVSDNCGGAITLSIQSTATNQNCGRTFVATRVWLASDVCGNSTTCTQVVTIIDVTGPALTCPTNLMVACAAEIPSANFAGGSVTDDGDPNPTVVHVSDTSSGSNPRIITRTYRATDACGNATTCSQTITVHDTNAPTISCSADVVAAADTNLCTASGVVLGTPIASDNCTFTLTNNAPAIFPLGTTLVIWTATDAVGNSITCTQRVIITDGSLAITSQPQSSTNNIGTDVTLAVAAAGCPDLSYQWYFSTNILAGNTNATLALTNIQPSQAGDYSVQVSNAGGSITSAVAVLKVNTAPALPAQNDRTIAENTALIVTNAATDADVPANLIVYELVAPPAGANIDTNGVITWTPGEEQGPGTNTFTTVATDEGGLSATNSFIVSVTEVNLPPTVDAMTDRTVNPGQNITFTATATDADRPTNTLSFSLLTPPSGAGIDSNGLFLWRPTMAQRDTTNVIRVRVQDDGSPSLSGTNSFSVIVNPLAPVILKSINYSEFDVSGTAGPDYIIMASPDLLNWTDIATNVSPAIPFHFNDPNAGAFSNRFYKARLAP